MEKKKVLKVIGIVILIIVALIVIHTRRNFIIENARDVKNLDV